MRKIENEIYINLTSSFPSFLHFESIKKQSIHGVFNYTFGGNNLILSQDDISHKRKHKLELIKQN